MIPKRLFLYWGRNQPLSFLRWMTVASFSQLNPDWEIRVYYPKTAPQRDLTWDTPEHKALCECHDWFDKLDAIPNVSVRPFEFDTIAVSDIASEVHKSDFLRWRLLSQLGGWWSDFDILFVKPMTALKHSMADVVVCAIARPRRGDWFNMVGFLASAKEDGWQFFSLAKQRAHKRFDPRSYQCAGRFALDDIYQPDMTQPTQFTILNLPSDIVYPLRSMREIPLLHEDGQYRLGDSTIGLHWFAGHQVSKHFENQTTPENLKQHTGLLYRQMRRIHEDIKKETEALREI